MRNHKNVAVVILAAGKGTRMKSDLAKVLHKVDGKSMVAHVVGCAARVAGENIHVVIGHQADQVKNEVVQDFDVHFALQTQLLGTGDAVKAVLPDLNPKISDVLVLCGDVPLIQPETLNRLIDGHRKSNAKVTVLATNIDKPTGYGRLIVDDDNNLVCIREEADASDAEKKITTINAGIYCFDKKSLVSAIGQLRPDNNQDEYYLTDVIAIAKKKNQKLSVVVTDDPRQVIGVNTLEELEMAGRLIHQLDG